MSELNIGKVIIDQTKTSQVVVNYQGTSKPDTSTITSNRSQMTATVESITTAFEASKTYYFDENGGLSTSNEGYGVAGTTDSNGVLTVAHSIPTITARYQILSENCDFITIDSCPVGTTKIAIAGHIYNMTGVVKLGGETIAYGFSLNLAVLILYDIQTKMIDFIKTSSNTTSSETAGSYVKILDADDTYIYWLREQSGYYLTKITISDGTAAESSVFGGTSVSGSPGKASMCADADYCYVIYPYHTDKRRVMGIRITKSTLALGTATDLAFNPSEWTEWNNNFVCTDGTYLYWVQNAGFVDTQVVRSSMTIASQSIVATYHAYDAGSPPLRTLPYNAVYVNSKLYVSMYDDSPAQKWTYDGTNKASVGGRLSLANGIILSSKSGTLQKLSSSLSIDWNKDYAGDAVSGEGTVVYVGEKYYYVGYSSGDFDGNNPTNTKRCAIIGKIDIANGDL